jgi:SAM-dependent methyltransferase
MIKNNSQSVKKKNIEFFSQNTKYQQDVNSIDTYRILYEIITQYVKGTDKLLDIGHGGSFDYDTDQVNEITGLDLDQMIDTKYLSKNIKLEIGSALEVPNNLINFDAVLLVMLIHHLIGENVNENLENLNKCISECKKTLSKKGKIVIVESCVPKWFYFIEKLLFKPSSYLINKLLKHPPAFQYTSEIIFKVLEKNGFKDIRYEKVKQGKFILQYGFKFPTFLTPVETIIFTAIK